MVDGLRATVSVAIRRCRGRDALDDATRACSNVASATLISNSEVRQAARPGPARSGSRLSSFHRGTPIALVACLVVALTPAMSMAQGEAASTGDSSGAPQIESSEDAVEASVCAEGTDASETPGPPAPDTPQEASSDQGTPAPSPLENSASNDVEALPDCLRLSTESHVPPTYYGSVSLSDLRGDLIALDRHRRLRLIDIPGLIGAQRAGKRTLIYFWGAWCKPCLEEMPLLSEIADEYADSLNIIGLSDGYIDERDYLEKVAEVRGLTDTYNLSRQYFTLDGSIMRQIFASGTAVLPALALFDPAGLLSYRALGSIEDAAHHRTLIAALSQGSEQADDDACGDDDQDALSDQDASGEQESDDVRDAQNNEKTPPEPITEELHRH